MVTKMIGVKDFRQNMAKYAASGRRNGWQYLILNRNEAIFELKPLSKKEAAFKKLAAEIAEARQQVREGKVHTLEEVRRHLGL